MSAEETYISADEVLSKTTIKIGAANLAVGIIGVVLLALATRDAHIALSFIAGFIVGVFNLYRCLTIIRASMTLPSEAIESFIKKRYMAKFSFSILFLVILIWAAKLHPLALLAGYGATITITVITLLIILKGEFWNNA